MTPERRRDRYGPARPRPSLWAGHKAAEAKLLASGHAYRDFARPEEFDEERKAAQVAGKPYLSSRRFAAFDDETARRFEAEGRQSVVRLKMPRDGALVIDDKVRGRVKFAWEREQDHVIQRVDGSCLYHLASVVDDHGLAMTHVIRAEEHLSNTPRQAFIALSLGYELPTYAHLPLVAEPGSRTKLSKRKLAQYLKNADFKQVMDHGMKIADRVGLKAEADTLNPVIVDFYSEVGYLPWAIDNYLPLLGWSYDDKTEFFSHDDLIQHFTLERIHSSPASFDSKKLWAVQDHSMGERSTDEKLALMLPFLVKAKLVSDPPAAAAVTMVRKVIEAALKQAVQAAGVKVSDLVHAVRVAMTGKTVGPGLYDCLAILGREQSLSRIARALPMCG